jgi:U3 small nucleolar RNA-associated protein 10
MFLKMSPASGQPRREDIDMILASSGADAGVRLIAVKELVKSVSGKDVSSLENVVRTLSLSSIDHSSSLYVKESIRNALVSRIQDNDISILEALYENATITPIISSDPQAYVSSLSLAIGSTEKPKRNILRCHLTYLASHFWTTAEVSTQELIFHQLIFPFLLFSRPRRKTAELVWEIIGNDLFQTLGSSITDWLAGCAALVKTQEAPEGSDSVNNLNKINLSISAKIAGEFPFLSW